MLATIHSYFAVPGRLRFLVGWLAQFLLFLMQIAVLALLAWAVYGIVLQRGGLLNPQLHEPFSPDFISDHPHQIAIPRRQCEI